jgi:polysaccharide deacetylase family protein (PEP-CTERM system associated)
VTQLLTTEHSSLELHPQSDPGFDIVNAPPAVVLSFDVEEHDRIEAAAGLNCPPALRAEYGQRMESCTRWLLDRLGEAGIPATFYIVGDIAVQRPELVRDIHRAGHEIGSHGWDHRRVHRLGAVGFRNDLRQSCDALEQVTGTPVRGFRAPTFSVMQSTAWAVDILAEHGLTYDSSVFPVRHDRYGVPQAPRSPFWLEGNRRSLLELPPATWRQLGINWPAGGGGYFRLLPMAVTRAAIRQLSHVGAAPVAVLYFHPWEFDADQPRLPLGRLSAWRTYVGTQRSRPRLLELLAGRYRFRRAIDVADELRRADDKLPRFRLAG